MKIVIKTKEDLLTAIEQLERIKNNDSLKWFQIHTLNNKTHNPNGEYTPSELYCLNEEENDERCDELEKELGDNNGDNKYG